MNSFITRDVQVFMLCSQSNCILDPTRSWNTKHLGLTNSQSQSRYTTSSSWSRYTDKQFTLGVGWFTLGVGIQAVYSWSSYSYTLLLERYTKSSLLKQVHKQFTLGVGIQIVYSWSRYTNSLLLEQIYRQFTFGVGIHIVQSWIRYTNSLVLEQVFIQFTLGVGIQITSLGIGIKIVYS